VNLRVTQSVLPPQMADDLVVAIRFLLQNPTLQHLSEAEELLLKFRRLVMLEPTDIRIKHRQIQAQLQREIKNYRRLFETIVVETEPRCKVVDVQVNLSWWYRLVALISQWLPGIK